MPRTDAEIQKDLEVWEKQLDLHLGHCEVCNESSEVYCKAGEEISYMLTSLMMERVRLQVMEQHAAQQEAAAAEEREEAT